MSIRIYTVFGAKGEYSGETFWPLVSYSDENLAKEHVTRASQLADEIAFLHHNLYKHALAPSARSLTPEEIKESDRISRLNFYDTTPQDWLEKHGYYYETTNLVDNLPRRKKGCNHTSNLQDMK